MALTLDDLRQMDGRPVWCKWWRVQGWALVHTYANHFPDGAASINVRLLHPRGCSERIDSDASAGRLDVCSVSTILARPLTSLDLMEMDGALVWVADASLASGGAFALLDVKSYALVLSRADASGEYGRYFADADSGWSFGDGVKVFATQKEAAAE